MEIAGTYDGFEYAALATAIGNPYLRFGARQREDGSIDVDLETLGIALRKTLARLGRSPSK